MCHGCCSIAVSAKLIFLAAALTGLPGEHEARCFRAREVVKAAPDLRHVTAR